MGFHALSSFLPEMNQADGSARTGGTQIIGNDGQKRIATCIQSKTNMRTSVVDFQNNSILPTVLCIQLVFRGTVESSTSTPCTLNPENTSICGPWTAWRSRQLLENDRLSIHLQFTLTKSLEVCIYIYIYMCKNMQIVFQVNSSSSKHEIFQEPNGITFRLGATVRSLYTNRHKLYYNKQ